MERPLVDQEYLLEKFEGKGGWTFVRIPEILQDKNAHFGWVKVKGTIDGFEIRKYHLMPMGNGTLFLPVRAEIRKSIKKQQGDFVKVVLYPDNEPLEVPEEMEICLLDEPKAHSYFYTLTESEQKYFIQWIYSAKKEETKIERLAKAIDMLANKEKMYSKPI